MRLIMICVVIAFVLTVLLAPSVVLANDPPDWILVTPGEGAVIHNDEFNIAPPDILVKTPHGPRPPEGIPPGTY